MKSIETEKFKQGFKEAFDGFLSVRETHQQALAAGRLKNVMDWREEREAVFRKLKQFLITINEYPAVKDDNEFMLWVRDKLGELLDQEKMLGKTVRDEHRKLHDRLGSLRKGKRAIKGYRPYSQKTVQPRFLSSKT